MSHPTNVVAKPDPWTDPRIPRYLGTDVLIIDPRKQRECSAEAVAVIGNEFDWYRFEVVTVAPGKNGSYDVIEGQHRTLALQQKAKALNRTIMVPCMILPGSPNDKQQARLALEIVQGRRRHSAYEEWNLAYTSGEAHEVFATTVLDEMDLRLGKRQSSNTISAVATVRNIVHGGRFTAEYGAEVLRNTLAVIVEAFPTYDHNSNATRWDRYLLLAVAWIVTNAETYDPERLAESIKIRPAKQWVNLGKGDRTIPADVSIRQSIVAEYNRGKRSGRILEGNPES